MEQIHRINRRRAGKLEFWIKSQTGKLFFKGTSEAHNITEDTPVLVGWCCQDETEIWSEEETAPPCAVCPRNGFELSLLNQRLVRIWRLLDLTGRDRFMDEGVLREEAIDCALERYRINTSETYERLLFLEVEMMEHRRKNKPKPSKSTKGKKK